MNTVETGGKEDFINAQSEVSKDRVTKLPIDLLTRVREYLKAEVPTIPIE